MAKKNKTIYICDSCGEEALSWSGKCSFCGEWNTLKELKIQQSVKNHRENQSEIEIKKIDQIETTTKFRIDTGIGEFNRVLGGGLVGGSIILLGGEPGIGKSTITSQLCGNIEEVFYVSAEESLFQIKDRLERLGVSNSKMLLVSSGDLNSLEGEILKNKPKLLIIDSIQTVYLADTESSAGSLSQIKESALYLQRLAKENNISVLIIGHVTKEGNIAGPKIIEHLVDVVLYMEGDKNHEGRVVRGIKNRFGPTNEIGLFKMTSKGLVEVTNPSELFLKQRSNKPGSVISPILEGRRTLFIEIQALTLPTKFGYPKRTSAGFDLNRLNILAAVIEKSVGISLSNYDIYLNVVGGIKIKEPAADLAVASAIISSYKNKRFEEDLCIFGEVGLMGEVRRVSGEADRLKECKKMGYKYISSKEVGNLKKLSEMFMS